MYLLIHLFIYLFIYVSICVFIIFIHSSVRVHNAIAETAVNHTVSVLQQTAERLQYSSYMNLQIAQALLSHAITQLSALQSITPSFNVLLNHTMKHLQQCNTRDEQLHELKANIDCPESLQKLREETLRCEGLRPSAKLSSREQQIQYTQTALRELTSLRLHLFEATTVMDALTDAPAAEIMAKMKHLLVNGAVVLRIPVNSERTCDGNISELEEIAGKSLLGT